MLLASLQLGDILDGGVQEGEKINKKIIICD